jgi:hypothetical protein
MSPIDGIMTAKFGEWASNPCRGGEESSQLMGSCEKELGNKDSNLNPVEDLPKKAQSNAPLKSPPKHYWPNQFCLGDKKIDDRNHRLTLPPISVCVADDPDIIHVEEEMRGISKKDFEKAIREGSLNWIVCVMRNDGFNLQTARKGEAPDELLVLSRKMMAISKQRTKARSKREKKKAVAKKGPRRRGQG